MRHILFIIFLIVNCMGHSHAQTSPWEKAYNDLPQKERDEYYENARHFLQNIYYNQIAAAIEDVEIHSDIIEDLAGEEAGTARYLPEFLPEGGNQRSLTLSQYLMELCHTFQGKSNELEFMVSNIVEDKYVHGYNSPTNCFVRLNYDLEIRLHGQTLLKRPCRMCCLFPKSQYKKRIRLMQIEPVEEGVITSAVTASDDERFQEAMEWHKQGLEEKYLPVFKELAEKGYKEAEYQYGEYLFWRGNHHGLFWLKRASNKNHVKAQTLLGCCYENGWGGIEKNDKEAIKWYTKAAEQGDATAQYFLGACYYNLQNFTKATEWLAKSAEQGNSYAQLILAQCYENGEGIPQDYGNAKELYQKAAEWYTKAANQGLADAQYYLGYLYQYGKGVYQSHTTAAEWFAKATEQGHLAAQYELGTLYRRGLGIPRDEQKGLGLIAQAAEQGYTEAQFALGRYYDFDIASQNGNSFSTYWYTQAAEQGHAQAQRYLGCYYLTGRGGLPQDYKKGAEWIRKAAEQGLDAAQYNLAQCYERGEGVPKDLEEAIEWYAKAAEQGFTDAKQALARLKQQ